VAAKVSGNGLGQHLQDVRRRDSVRRLQAVRLRERLGREALEQYLQTKTVWVDLAE
jgi:hypothetical protein